MISEERIEEIQDYVMKSTLTEGFEDPMYGTVPDVYKRLVTGYLIIKTDDGRVTSRPVYQGSDCSDDDMFEVFTFLNCGEELLGIVPATKMTFAVYGCLPETMLALRFIKQVNMIVSQINF